MKKSLLSNMKIWITVTLSVLLVGMVLFGIFGFAKSVDYKDGYEISVTANDILDDSVDVMKNATEKYFNDNGLKPVKGSSQTLNGGETLVYKFYNDVSDHKEGLKAAVQEALDSKGLTVTVDSYETIKEYDSYAGYAILAGCIVLAAAFVYCLITDKNVASGLALLAASIVSVLLYMSLTAIIRVSFAPFGVAMGVFAGLLSLVYSFGILARCKDTVKKDVKAAAAEIGEKAALKSSLRICVIECTIIVLGIIAIIAGGGVLASFGALALIASASSAFTSIIFAAPIWAALLGTKPGKNVPAK
ncbi:MAG: hypothetical protein J6Y43_05125, partial [Clostridia bacterium]|nr:hypothetical protein [Clostridia bacterium]